MKYKHTKEERRKAMERKWRPGSIPSKRRAERRADRTKDKMQKVWAAVPDRQTLEGMIQRHPDAWRILTESA